MTEKGGTQRWQPVTPTLAARLIEYAQARGAVTPTDALLRYRNGRRATYRRYDLLWKRIGQQLPWVAGDEHATVGGEDAPEVPPAFHADRQDTGEYGPQRHQ